MCHGAVITTTATATVVELRTRRLPRGVTTAECGVSCVCYSLCWRSAPSAKQRWCARRQCRVCWVHPALAVVHHLGLTANLAADPATATADRRTTRPHAVSGVGGTVLPAQLCLCNDWRGLYEKHPSRKGLGADCFFCFFVLAKERGPFDMTYDSGGAGRVTRLA